MAKAAKKANEGREAVADLNSALSFAKVAIRDIGEPYQTHIILWDGMLFSHDGTLATGHPIAENIRACPQGSALRAALARCRHPVALGVGTASLDLKSGPLRVSIPCLDFALVRPFQPDANAIPISDETIKAGFAILGPLVKEGATTVLEAGLKLGASTMVASNRIAILEYWHGIALPRTMVIPKAAIQAILAAPYKLAGFGCSADSATFWFDNKSWIKTQLFAEEYPDTDKILNKKAEPIDLPEGFLEGVKSVIPFGNDAYHVIYDAKGLHSGNIETGALGASYEIEGINQPIKMRGYEWETIGKHIQKVDWHTQPNMVMFFADKMRGALAKIGM